MDALLYSLSIIIAIGVILFINYHTDTATLARLHKDKRDIVDFSTCKDDELVKIHGSIYLTDRALTAPFSYRKCCWCFVEVFDSPYLTFNNRRHRRPKRIYRDTITGEVILFDGLNHVILQNPVICSTFDGSDWKEQEDLMGPLQDHIKQYLIAHNIKRGKWVNERILEHGISVTAIGRIKKIEKGDGRHGTLPEEGELFLLLRDGKDPVVVYEGWI
ncbi:MAG: hypothetical protein QM534_05610 [Sediminibacterium sp.]|nr:hypothetical protein [Sediminibacterium sp.]